MMDSIIVLSDGISFGEGSVANATFFDDQPFGQGYKTNKARQGVMIVERTFPVLLRRLADIMEQEGVETIEDLSPAVQRMVAESRAAAEASGG